MDGEGRRDKGGGKRWERIERDESGWRREEEYGRRERGGGLKGMRGDGGGRRNKGRGGGRRIERDESGWRREEGREGG